MITLNELRGSEMVVSQHRYIIAGHALYEMVVCEHGPTVTTQNAMTAAFRGSYFHIRVYNHKT